MRPKNRPGRDPLARVERLEARQLLASAGSTSLFVTAAYSQLMSDLKTMELHSRATPAEYLALRDDARAISEASSASTLTLSTAQQKAAQATTIIDRSTIDGGLTASNWSDVVSRLETNLTGLGVSQSLIDQTVADMKATAASADVSAAEYLNFNKDFTSLSTAESIPGNLSYGDLDPSLYFGQHLGGFFRGWASGRMSDVRQLKSDLKSIPASVDASAADRATLSRDANLLEKLGSKLPTSDNSQFLSTYTASLSQAGATEQGVSELSVNLASNFAMAPTRSQLSQMQTLAKDAPGFYRALGSSPTNVQTITADIQAVVNDGVRAAPNPFKITVTKTSS